MELHLCSLASATEIFQFTPSLSCSTEATHFTTAITSHLIHIPHSTLHSAPPVTTTFHCTKPLQTLRSHVTSLKSSNLSSSPYSARHRVRGVPGQQSASAVCAPLTLIGRDAASHPALTSPGATALTGAVGGRGQALMAREENGADQGLTRFLQIRLRHESRINMQYT